MVEPIITISSEALEMILQLRDQEPGEGEIGLFLEVTGVRAGQFAYELAFIPVSDADEDHVVEHHDDLAVIIPERDRSSLAGSSLNLNDEGLAMDNPNRPAAPASPAMQAPQGDLGGPLADQIQQVLEEAINPSIASHGGRAELVSVDGSTAYLKLAGGCQGCGMAQVTLKQGIERILLEAIPEVTEVVDVTDHAAGSDPYYQSSKK
ncbi:MAG TPA: NifU family protein [Acidimicrobiia bacterium]|nr:NifU family protein [Acidimicrobiia bacterium]